MECCTADSAFDVKLTDLVLSVSGILMGMRRYFRPS